MTRVAVIGHTEWLTHARGRLPPQGEIAVLGEPFDEPAGGGAVSAAQVARLGHECLFFTAVGDDEAGRAVVPRLEAEGVRVLAARRRGPHARALSVTGASVDRAILVVGLAPWPTIEDPLPWDELAGCAAVYFTGRDPATLVAARAAGRVVVTGRRREVLVASGVRADLLVTSADDPAEAVDPAELPVAPDAIVWTEGARGGRYRDAGGAEGRWSPVPPPGPAVDSYGCGDSFVAGLTVGLARGWALPRALELGARAGAANLTARGGLAGQLREPAPA